MNKISRVTNFDFQNFPNNPCAIWFNDAEGNPCPKKMFTVTRKRINKDTNKVEIYVVELQRYLEYDDKSIKVVTNFFLS